MNQFVEYGNLCNNEHEELADKWGVSRTLGGLKAILKKQKDKIIMNLKRVEVSGMDVFNA